MALTDILGLNYNKVIHIFPKCIYNIIHVYLYNTFWTFDDVKNIFPECLSGIIHLYVKTKSMDVPIQFWFNNNAGLALPLVALTYPEHNISICLKDVF